MKDQAKERKDVNDGRSDAKKGSQRWNEDR